MYEGIPSGLKPPSTGYGGAEIDKVFCIMETPSKVIAQQNRVFEP